MAAPLSASGKPVGQTVRRSHGRGRRAEKPTDIPAKGWKDIVWRLYDGIQNDRVLLVAAGVTFYAILALFPATAAIVSLFLYPASIFATPPSLSIT